MPEREKKLSSGAYALRLGKSRETRRIEDLHRDSLRSPTAASQVPGAIALMVVRVGLYRIAIEATRLIGVRAGAVLDEPEDPRRPITRADLHHLLREPARDSCQTVIARADGRTGRGDGARVSFAVDDCDRLVVVPLEALAPLPPIAREQIEVDFLVGVALLPTRSEAVRAIDSGQHALPGRTRSAFLESAIERAAFLLDPVRLARAAELESQRESETAHG